MSRVFGWLLDREQRVFRYVNRRLRRTWLDRAFGIVTHLGGATVSIAGTLGFALFAGSDWQRVGWIALATLAISHIPVAVLKRTYRRLRPYQIWPDTFTGPNPLKDHSFPSGHTTAIFSALVPYVLEQPLLAPLLLPIAGIVGLSRIYLGLHYPSDVLAGALLGSVTASCLYAWIP